ncbi:MAG: rhomboid family protein [Thermodesulfobacteriota bacterium]|nr:rhomboid family protein [Thermodesulfobacteriota bacterium]
MEDLSHQCCYNHELREAVARCPECSNYFCRECITEHDDRVLCASCLNDLLINPGSPPPRLNYITQIALSLFGILTLWVFFYYLGQALLLLPSSFHEGTLWQTDWGAGK